MKRVALAIAVAAAAWTAWSLATLPPRTRVAPAGPLLRERPFARGVYHVHSKESDGTGTIAEIAEAASRAGLQFVILTDHGDGTRPRREPRYYRGVLVVEAVEISTDQGHYAALGLPVPPYPLGGEARDVVEDVARLGGFGIAAHPDSARRSLQWHAWDAPIDGIEWFNADSQWRDEPAWRLLRALFQYPVRPAETVASMFARPSRTLARWDVMTRGRQVVGMAGSDAHARIGIGGGSDPYEGGLTAPVPSYEALFRAMSLGVELAEPLSGRAPADAALVEAAIRNGHLYTVISGQMWPAKFTFEGRSGGARARQGDRLPIRGLVHLSVDANIPPDSTITLFENGREVWTAREPTLDWSLQGTDEAPPRPGTYRVEVRLPGRTGAHGMPWIVSNPIYVGLDPRAAARGPARPPARLANRLAAAPPWTIEKDATSTASVAQALDGGRLVRTFRVRLGPDRAASPFAALVTADVDPFRDADRITFRGWADRPMRVSVQFRAPGGPGGLRWQRSVYLDTTPRDVSVFFDDMHPVSGNVEPHPERARINTLLFVIDTTNARPGMAGTAWLEDVRAER